MMKTALFCIVALAAVSTAFGWSYEGWTSSDCSGSSVVKIDKCKAGDCCKVTFNGDTVYAKGACDKDGAGALVIYSDSSCATPTGTAVTSTKAQLNGKCQTETGGGSYKASCSPASSFQLLAVLAVVPAIVALVL